MNIAVLMGGVGFDTQKRMINGILDSAHLALNMKTANTISITCRILHNMMVLLPIWKRFTM